MAQDQVQLYRYSQESALVTFLPILNPHLPISNSIYNRIRSPVNLPSRHCLFAATFPPTPSPTPENYTIIFADRSRHAESQIWIFNPLQTISGPLSPAQRQLLNAHVTASILFLKNTSIPEAPGWPFHPHLKFACVHEKLVAELVPIGEAKDAVRKNTTWNLWVVDTSSVSSLFKTPKALPEGYSIGRVPANQIDAVISTSSIPRQKSTYLGLPSAGILNAEGLLVAWGYIGPDCSFATLFVQPDFRGMGLAKTVAVELLSRLHAGSFADLGFDGSSGWVHADVHDGNTASEAVMKSIGGKNIYTTSYVWIDSEKF